MSDKPVIRKSEIIQEEIDDLHRYLNGIPEQLRTNSAFNSYERRKIELNRELVVSRSYNFHGTVDVKPNVRNRQNPRQVL